MRGVCRLGAPPYPVLIQQIADGKNERAQGWAPDSAPSHGGCPCARELPRPRSRCCGHSPLPAPTPGCSWDQPAPRSSSPSGCSLQPVPRGWLCAHVPAGQRHLLVHPLSGPRLVDRTHLLAPGDWVPLSSPPTHSASLHGLVHRRTRVFTQASGRVSDSQAAPARGDTALHGLNK